LGENSQTDELAGPWPDGPARSGQRGAGSCRTDSGAVRSKDVEPDPPRYFLLRGVGSNFRTEPDRVRCGPAMGDELRGRFPDRAGPSPVRSENHQIHTRAISSGKEAWPDSAGPSPVESGRAQNHVSAFCSKRETWPDSSGPIPADSGMW
jgi:hypothetical protein